MRKEECHYKDTLARYHSSELRSASQSRGSNTPPVSARPLGDFIASPLAMSGGNDEQPAPIRTIPNPDLELLHHYTISTSISLASSTCQEGIWQDVAPQEAFFNPFLMHAILAVAALHLAYLRPASARHYNNLAMEHYTSAVSLFRPVLNGISADNAVSAFLCAGIFTCISFAMPQDPLQPFDLAPSATKTLQQFLHTFHLQRGVKQVLGASWSAVEHGVLTPIFGPDFNDPESALPDLDEAPLRILEDRIHAESGSEDLKTIYVDAVQLIRKCYPFEFKTKQSNAVVLAWPVLISPEFFNEMIEEVPMAIAILCYYGTLLYRLRDVWWARDNGRALVSTTSELLTHDWDGLTKWASLRVDVHDNT